MIINLNYRHVGKRVKLRNGQLGTLVEYITNEKRAELKRDDYNYSRFHILDKYYPYLVLLDAEGEFSNGENYYPNVISYSSNGKINGDDTCPDLDIIELF